MARCTAMPLQYPTVPRDNLKAGQCPCDRRGHCSVALLSGRCNMRSCSASDGAGRNPPVCSRRGSERASSSYKYQSFRSSIRPHISRGTTYPRLAEPRPTPLTIVNAQMVVKRDHLSTIPFDLTSTARPHLRISQQVVMLKRTQAHSLIERLPTRSV